MQPLRIYSVVSKLPPKLKPLWDLAYNCWFSWNNEIMDLFFQMDQKLWQNCYGNPVSFLNRIPQRTLQELAEDEFFIERLNDLKNSLDAYTSRKTSAIPFPVPTDNSPLVAYLSLEFGLALCLPIYSGGLGILAGDHLKSASDLAIPLVGIGFCYNQGYFRQYLTPDGWQQERYPTYDFEQMPITPVLDSNGKRLIFSVDLKPNEKVFIQIWKAKVGRISLYLLDTNIGENPAHYRAITSKLYGGNLEMRLWQEIVLGIGGIKALDALGLSPKVIHMNEGHSAFAGLERIRKFMSEGKLSFESASELVAASSAFTTHTPVPAGNDRFPPELMQAYFEPYASSLGLAFKVFLALGREDPRNDSEPFCMTVLALRLSRFNNGVSRLHGRVSRKMWERVWPQFPVEDVPIGAITNGVHFPSWVAPELGSIYDRYLGGNWREDSDFERVFSNAESISDAELWRTHERLRERLIDFVRYRLSQQIRNRGGSRKEIELVEEVLDPGALTIGFARRFATYKRATLFLEDTERLLNIMKSNPKRPVQFIFAGKAHPHDNEGKKFIQQIVQICNNKDFHNRIVFIEDYDMEVASYMLSGCDVWMNNPRRPLEACGTSGMKAVANGVLNFSTLDGWWDEAWISDNSVGWAIGLGEEYKDTSYQDFVESQTLYNILESEIIPTFYDRGHGNLPRNWIQKMKTALVKLGPVFNSHRMVNDYSKNIYVPAIENYDVMIKDNYKAALDLSSWRMKMMTNWDIMNIRNIQTPEPSQLFVGDPIPVSAEIFLGEIGEQDIIVEIYSGTVDQTGSFADRCTYKMVSKGQTDDGWHKYYGEAMPKEAGRFGFTVRILPHHPLMFDPHSLGLIRWANINK